MRIHIYIDIQKTYDYRHFFLLLQIFSEQSVEFSFKRHNFSISHANNSMILSKCECKFIFFLSHDSKLVDFVKNLRAFNRTSRAFDEKKTC